MRTDPALDSGGRIRHILAAMMNQLSQRLIEPDRPLRVHLIGVAGSGMSGLALLLLDMGHLVSGSDRVSSSETSRMQRLGLDFSSPHGAEAVQDAELVVYSSAIRPENPAYAAAMAAGIPVIRRAECLAAILGTRTGIVISGTHGKTTTSSLCAHLLREAGQKPSHYVGAEIPILGANAHWSREGEFMVAEGDESDGTLALYRPRHAVILNIEAEHLDHYSGIEEIVEVFRTLAAHTTGALVCCGENALARELAAAHPHGLTYGWSNADFTAHNVRDLRGSSAFEVFRGEQLLGDVELGIPGRHNVLNALAAIAIALECGASFQRIARGLASFAGAKRRFETRFLGGGIRIVDDYGHHPTEVEATLATARGLAPENLVVVFQPHRYSRTQAMADDFGRVLQAADRVFITPIYAASENPIPGVSGESLVEAMSRHGTTEATYLPKLADAHHAIGRELERGDLLLTLGAGNVHEVGRRIIDDLKVLQEMTALAADGEVIGRLYEPLRRHTTMLVGGPAQFWLEPRTFAGFSLLADFCRERGIPIRVIGRGSNLLVRDGGVRGAVIHPTGGEFARLEVVGDGRICAAAGVRLKKLASFAMAAGIGGFEWMEGIPGNVGGALRMNAGAMGSEMFDQVVELTFLDEAGEIRTRPREEIEAEYRNVPLLRRNFALQAVFHGEPNAAPEKMQERWDSSRAKRRGSQPIGASAGCVFRNPETIPAGMLVEAMGLKGGSHGEAMVSDAHGNFIINQGGAKCADVIALIESIQAEAKTTRGIDLETEVKIIGEDIASF